MPFLFSHTCDLLDELEELHFRPHPLLPKDLYERATNKAIHWLKNHKFDLNAFSTQEDAVLWILRPDKLVDREYGIDASRLEHIIARVYELSHKRYVDLQLWRTMQRTGDLGARVQVVRDSMKVSTLLTKEMVTVEEVQNLLLRIASFNVESSAEVQSLSKDSSPVDVIDCLGAIFKRLNARDAKWFTRYILKDYRAILLPDTWEVQSGYLGMPNVTSITINMFDRPPPVPVILSGTQLRRGRKLPRSIATGSLARSGLRKTDFGWPKRPLVQSREASPIASPIAFKKGLLASNSPTTLKDTLQLENVATLPLAIGNLNVPAKQASPKTPAKFDILDEASSEVTLVNHPRARLHQGLVHQAGKRRFPNGMNCSPPICGESSSPSFNVASSATLVNSSPAHKKPTARPDTGSQSCKLTKSARSAASKNASTAVGIVKESRFQNVATVPTSPLSTLSTNSQSQLPRHSKPATDQNYSIPTQDGNGVCRGSSPASTCSLLRCIFLLAPALCIHSRLTSSIIPHHGNLYFSNPAQLAHPAFPQYCPKTKFRYRKIVLVDTYDRIGTVALLREVQALNLTREVTCGKRKRGSDKTELVKDWLEVYDWRMLELVSKMEEGKVYDYDIWKRCFVCTI